MNKFLLKDSSGERSVTHTAFVVGFVIACVKLLLSGNTFGKIAFDTFTGVDFATVVGALGTVYSYRRASGKKNDQEKEHD